MEKVVLSEIDLYTGEIKTPKGFEIQRTPIKNQIIQAYAGSLENPQNRISNNLKDYSYLDYKLGFSQPLCWLQDHMRDFFRLNYHKTLIPKLTWGNIYKNQEQSFSRTSVDPVDLRNAPDYTFIYGIDVAEDSCELIIEYNDNRRAGRTWHIPMKNNFFTLFPSTQKYFISENKSKKINIFLTSTYEYI